MDAGNGSARRRNVVDRIVARAGGASVLARYCGVRPQSVQDWQRRNVVPPLRVLGCERASGIPRWQIRPDLYPPPESETPR
jgi:DNA-binding transcriptional regulator YdaS (Cro superfamily)